LAFSLALGLWLGTALTNGKWQAKLAREQAAQIEAQKRMVKNADNAATKYQSESALVDANLAVLTGTLDRLRADLAAIGSPSAPSSPEATRIAGILGECASEVVRLAGAADTLAGKVTGWQDWFEATSQK
jgi:hypothetical protein